MKRQLKAIIFDLDGVITDTADNHFLAWSALAKELNIPFSRGFNEQLKGISRVESLEKILAIGGKESVFTAEDKIRLANKKNEHYKKLIQQISPRDLLPGIKEFILEIKEHGIKLGLASSSKNAIFVIESLGLKEQFDVIVDVDTIKKCKPDPEIFLTAVKHLNVDLHLCIGIEDAVAGIEAIKRAGMFAVGIGSRDILSKADIVYESTSQLFLNNILLKYGNV